MNEWRIWPQTLREFYHTTLVDLSLILTRFLLVSYAHTHTHRNISVSENNSDILIKTQESDNQREKQCKNNDECFYSLK